MSFLGVFSLFSFSFIFFSFGLWRHSIPRYELSILDLDYIATEWRTVNIGGRTMQILPKEAKVTGQIGAQRITNYKEIMFIISLPYIGRAKQDAKHTKKIPMSKGACT